MNDSHVYEWTLSSFWKQLYEEVTSLCFVLPDTVGVARASDKLSKIAAGTTGKTVITLFAPTTTSSSLEPGKQNKKRIKSRGETGYTLVSSTTSSAIVKKEKTKICQLCGNINAMRTKHVCRLLKKDVLQGNNQIKYYRFLYCIH
jgi:hypothetical protein